MRSFNILISLCMSLAASAPAIGLRVAACKILLAAAALATVFGRPCRKLSGLFKVEAPPGISLPTDAFLIIKSFASAALPLYATEL